MWFRGSCLFFINLLGCQRVLILHCSPGVWSSRSVETLKIDQYYSAGRVLTQITVPQGHPSSKPLRYTRRQAGATAAESRALNLWGTRSFLHRISWSSITQSVLLAFLLHAPPPNFLKFQTRKRSWRRLHQSLYSSYESAESPRLSHVVRQATSATVASHIDPQHRRT